MPQPIRFLTTTIALFTVCMLVRPCPAPASPFHPDLRERLGAQALAELPREPVPVEGVQGAAGFRQGRNWTRTPKLLVLQVTFDDRPADPEAFPPSELHDRIFGLGTHEFGTLREYYREVSYGLIDVTGTIEGPFLMPDPYVDYSVNMGFCNGCSQRLTLDALLAADAAGVDFTQYDNDGPDGVPGSGDDDGIIDALAVMFPGRGAERTGELDRFRSHYNTFGSSPVLDGVRIPDFFLFPEGENVGVAVHELGHVFGGDDLYDLSGQAAGLGNFSVLAYGHWLMNAPPAGRARRVHPGAMGTRESSRAQGGRAAFPAPCGAGRTDGDPSLDPGRWPAGSTSCSSTATAKAETVSWRRAGCCCIHVVEWRAKQTRPGQYRVRLVAADGLKSLEGEAPLNFGEPGDFFPGAEDVRVIADHTVPSTRNAFGDPTGVSIRDISDPGEVMTATLGVGQIVTGGPAPRLEVIPATGFFDTALGVGDYVVRVVNDGSRITGGTLRLFTRDSRVQVLERWEATGVSLATLGEIRFETPLRLGIAELDPADVTRQGNPGY